MARWRTPIRCYVSPAGNNKIADWYDHLSTVEQAFVDVFLKNMRALDDWSRDYKQLAGLGKLGELRWKMGNTQHRLLGFFKDGVWYALIGCTHKQQVYKPADALDTARKYMKLIDKGEANTVEYDL